MSGRNIAFLRKKKGINQEELAQALFINVATLSRWENGHFEPKASDIKKLCEVLHCTESELLNDASSNDWELRIKISKESVIEMSKTGSSAELSVGDTAMAITLSANYDLWEDDAKFEALVEDLRAKRHAGLKLRKEGW